MPFTLEDVVPWGRVYEEYTAMFALSADDLKGRILGCGDGPASFNAEATRQGYNVVSSDPLYAYSTDQIEARVHETYDLVTAKTQENAHQFVWDHFKNVQQLGETRMRAMRGFLDDFEVGKQNGRYIEASLPDLPFGDGEFDLALCSHFLFLYSEQLSLDFHIEAVREMCRVAREARIFPLHNLANEYSEHIEPLTHTLVPLGYHVERMDVPYEFQKGAHYMLTVSFAGNPT